MKKSEILSKTSESELLFDKYITTISSAGIAIALALVTNTTKVLQQVDSLLVAIIAFGSCLVLIVVSYFLSIIAWKKKQKEPSITKYLCNTAVNCLRVVNLSAFIVGIIALIIFVFANIAR